MKGSGNSRYLKTVGEALSLYPTYEDFMQAMVAGIFPVDFNGINKDGWTQLGTLLNKANLLSDTVISTLGLSTGVNSTPNDAFNVLANIGNVHVWRKTVVTEEEIPAGYTLGPVESNKVLAQSSSNWGNSYAAFTVASSITVDDGGNVTMNDTSGVEIWQGYFDPNKGEDNLLGKFIQFSHVSADHISSDLETGVYFIPSNATFIRDHSSAPFYTKISACQKVNAYPLTPAGTHITYLTSTNRNAYQEGDDAKEAGYVLGRIVKVTLGMSNTNDGTGVDWRYSDSVTVTPDGVVSLGGSPTQLILAGWSDPEECEVLKGKFACPVTTGSRFSTNEVVFFPNDTVFSKSSVSGGHVAINAEQYQIVTGYPAIPAGTTIEYLGVLGNKTIIETGSYVGTGTYGKANPQTLTFNFDVKFFVLQGHDRNNYQVARIAVKGSDLFGSLSATNSTGLVTWNGSTVSWYGDDAPDQGNKQGSTYYYVALG
jgi:hypothetical protein